MHLPNTLCTAATLYHELEDLLFPACEKITVAGSVRRHYTKRMREDFARLIVNDVEIVCQPKMVRDGRNLFGECSALDGVLAELRSKGVLAGDPDRKADGERYKRLVYRGLALVDLFIVNRPAQWGAILAIRTGAVEFSKLLVERRQVGGAMPHGFRMHCGGLCYEPEHKGQPRDECTAACRVVTPTEESFFKALGLPVPELDRRTARDLQGILAAQRAAARKQEGNPHASAVSKTR